MRADTDVRYAVVAPHEFIDLICAHRPVFKRVMAQMQPVIGRTAQREQNRERLASLGTMAAGLAHELNNPASAARRTADELADALGVLSRAIGVFVEPPTSTARTPSGWWRCRPRRWSAARRAPAMSALDSADLEDELTDALTDVGVPEPWTLSSPLAAAGIDPRLRPGGRRPPPAPLTTPVLRWITASLSARQLAGELAAVDRADEPPGQGDQGLRLHGPRRGGPGRRPRGPGDDADDPRAQAQAHDDRGQARLRPRAAAR